MEPAGSAPEAAYLRDQRERRGWSQRQLLHQLQRAAAAEGHEIGVNISMISRWENGHRRPDAFYRRLLHKVYGPTLDPAPDEWESEMQRRAFLRTSAMTGLAILAPPLNPEPWERLSAALRRPRRVDATTTDYLEAVTVNFEQLYQRIAPVTLLSPVLGHLTTITRLLEGQQPDRARRRLAFLAGETAALAGWLTSDTGDHDAAQRYYSTAVDAAQEAGDNALGAYVLASASVLPAFRQSPQQTLRLLHDGAHGFRASHATATTRAWIGALEAEAHTNASHTHGALAALDRAEHHITRTDDRDPRPLVPFFDQARLAGEQGIAAVRLDRPHEAEQLLSSALDGLDPTAKIRSRLLTSLAAAHIQQGNIEQACVLAIESLQIATATETEPSLQAVHGLRRSLDPWHDADPVQQFDEQLATAVGD